MPTALRDIAVFLDASPAGVKIGRQAAELARRFDAHLIGVYGVSRANDTNRFAGFARGAAAMSQVTASRRNEEERKILAAGHRFADLTREYGISSEFRIVWREGLDDDSVLRALQCDLIVSTHPRPDDLPASWSAERLLLQTGTPVLLIPATWEGEAIGDHVVIAWNRSRESRRAVGDAMPFIRSAGRTTILTVDAARDAEHFGEEPGLNLRHHLSRHEVQADVVSIDAQGASVADMIASWLAEHGGDLLIFGAYSRSRASELLFGGTTRSLLASAVAPMLVSR